MTECVYVLRAEGGRYEEDLCGAAYQGSLVFVEQLDVDIDDGIVIGGWVCNGTDDSGVYGYHFSASEVPEADAYRVLLGDVHQAGDTFRPAVGMLATWTSP